MDERDVSLDVDDESASIECVYGGSVVTKVTKEVTFQAEILWPCLFISPPQPKLDVWPMYFSISSDIALLSLH